MNIKQRDDVLDLFLQKIRTELGSHLKQVILFGSRARGDFTEDSDYDCLVLVDDVSSMIDNKIIEIAGELLYQHNAVFSIFPIEEERYFRKKFDPLFMNVRKEGIIL